MTDTAPKLPHDFDWVTARHACSIRAFFERLLAAAEKNVATRNAQLPERAAQYELTKVDPELFSVTHSPTARNTAIVRFNLVAEGSRLQVTGMNINVNLEGTLTLNDRAECRLKVEGVELDVWQILCRTLEPMFFQRSQF